MKKNISMVTITVTFLIIATAMLFYANNTVYSYHQMKNIKKIASLNSNKDKIIGSMKLPHGEVNFSLQIVDNANNDIIQYEHQDIPQVKIIINKDSAENIAFKNNYLNQFQQLENELNKTYSKKDINGIIEKFKDRITHF